MHLKAALYSSMYMVTTMHSGQSLYVFYKGSICKPFCALCARKINISTVLSEMSRRAPALFSVNADSHTYEKRYLLFLILCRQGAPNKG